MPRRSQAWKDLEREAAELLGGKRVSRGDDFSKSDVDVVLPDLPGLRVDAKYRKAHAHHGLLSEVREKYCAQDGLVPVLVTKHHRQRGVNVTVEGAFFAELLRSHRLWRAHDGTCPRNCDNCGQFPEHTDAPGCICPDCADPME